MTATTITLCHAAGQAGTTQYVTLTLPPAAAATHLDPVTGTPTAGHEDDYLGPCEEQTTTTTTTTPPSSTTTTPPSTTSSTTTTTTSSTTTAPESSTTTVPDDSTTTTTPDDSTTTTVVLAPPISVTRHPDTGADLALAGPGVVALLLGSAVLAAVRHRRRPAA